MSKRKRAKLMILAGMALILLLIIIAIISLIVKLFKKPESIALSPNFTEQELDINSDYTFSITAKPEKIKLKKIKYEIDSDIATFKAASSDKKDKNAVKQAVLHTSSEGTITISVKVSKVTSNVLTYTVVDKAAREAEEAQTAWEAQMPPEQTAPGNENTGELVKTTTRVRIRTAPSTDGEILKTCDTGETFTRYGETDNGWSKIDYNGQEAYIKSDYLVPADTSGESNETAANNTAQPESTGNQATAKNTPASSTPANTASPAAVPVPAAAVNTASNTPAAEPVSNDAQTFAPEPESEPGETPAAAPAAAAAAGSVPYTDKNGVSTTFTADEWNYFLAYWDYTGQAEYFVHKHTCAELRAMYDATH